MSVPDPLIPDMQAPMGGEFQAVPAPPRCAWVPEHTNKVTSVGLPNKARALVICRVIASHVFILFHRPHVSG